MRELVITMPLLKKLVYVHGIRFISVSEGIDSARDGWEILATIIALQAENYIKELSHNVFRGHEGNVFANYSVGDYCFGYTSVAIPGTEKGRRGRNAQPRRAYAIDDIEAAWVIRIFDWFVKKNKSLRWIARELNRRGAPKDHRSSTPHWHHSYLPGVLRNRKYIGMWSWGETKTVRDPMTGCKAQDTRPHDDCKKWTRDLPKLRIVSDDVFEAAALRLDKNIEKYSSSRDSKGKFRGSISGNSEQNPRYLLSWVLACESCKECRLSITSTNGKYMFCPGYPRGVCTCRTTLRRELAERLILAEIGKRVIRDPVWLQAVLNDTAIAWQTLESNIPGALTSARSNLAELEEKIRIINDVLETGADSVSLLKRLKKREAERDEANRLLKQLEQTDAGRGPAPDEVWILKKLQTLENTLSGACPAAAFALRALVGGEIRITEIRQTETRGYLRATFTLRSRNVATALCPAVFSTDSTTESAASVEEVISIDIRERETADSIADDVMRLFNQGIKFREIAKVLGCGRSLVHKAFKRWHQAHNLPVPDGRTCRKRLPSHRKAEQLVEQVMQHWHQDLSYGEIATLMQCDRNVITECVRIYFTRQGLPLPDGRMRRKLLRKPD